MTRTVDDAALLMAVISCPDRRDPMCLPPAQIAWDDLAGGVKGLRIGLWVDAGLGMPAEPEVVAAVEGAARLLANAGAIVEPVQPFLTPAMLDGLDRFWRARSWSDICRLSPECRARVLPYIRAWAETAEGLSGLEVFDGFSQIAAMRDAALAASRPYDFLLSPTAPILAFAAELPSPTNDPARPLDHIGFTVAFNMSEQPALSINCGYASSGLPIGLQIVGQRFDDLGVLRLARAYEGLRPPQRPWPRP
jgi:aspartyl-tRNA(Asn)/glutamyl-tRNA(Gln) amidotransferase subunit A